MAAEQEPYELAKSSSGTSTIGQIYLVTSKSAPQLMAIFAETFAALH